MKNFSISLLRLLLTILMIQSVSYAGSHHHDAYCEVHLEDLNFGNYDPFEITITRVPIILTVRCTGSSTSFVVKFLGGYSNNFNERYLYSPSTGERLYYNLYYDNCPVGDGSGGSCVINGSCHKSHHGYCEIEFTLIGVILPHQNVSAANDYQDTLQVIIEY